MKLEHEGNEGEKAGGESSGKEGAVLSSGRGKCSVTSAFERKNKEKNEKGGSESNGAYFLGDTGPLTQTGLQT